MTAREMFERLGYARGDFRDCLEYYQADEEKGTWKKITFDKIDKTFYADADYEAMNINMKTLAAICQQVKELGWLDD